VGGSSEIILPSFQTKTQLHQQLLSIPKKFGILIQFWKDDSIDKANHLNKFSHFQMQLQQFSSLLRRFFGKNDGLSATKQA
jgi:hypothetical protein